MNGIDTSAAALLASRIGGLGAAGSQGSTGAAQAGVSALTGGAAGLADPRNAGSPQASAQTVLSAVALALDAIIRSGGEATPAVVGRAPIWADPAAAGEAMVGDAGSLPLPGLANPIDQTGATVQAQALEAALLADLEASTVDAPQAGLPGSAQGAEGADGAGSANGAANGGMTGGMTGGTSGASSSPQGTQDAQGAQAAQRTALAAQSGQVAALAAALAQTVASSGLFYESHLAQWLRGQRTPGELADEPQNRLTGGSAQLPLEFPGDRSHAAADIDDVLWIDLPSATQQGARAGGAAAAAASGARGETHAAAFADDAERAAGGTAAALADALLPATRTPAGAGAGVGVHEALLPLVRQQLDLLATGEFRWTGEAWPGVRLDWTIQPDDDERHAQHDSRAGRGADEDETPWRTRLTLALPALGTVDAELALTGSTLAVRVQASPGGAQRLNAHSEALRGRLEALGLALAGLSIREIGGAGGLGGLGGTAGVDGARAAGAYARAAVATHAAPATHAADAPHAIDSTDWELG